MFEKNPYGLDCYDTGSIFSLVTGDTVISKYFKFECSGYRPLGDVLEGPNGNLYGMTSQGGTLDMGKLFVYNISTKCFLSKINFTGSANGQNPINSLIVASNGKLYGVTPSGGTYGIGVLFSLDPNTLTLTKLYDFPGSAGGNSPSSSLMQSSNGKLYGTTKSGGTSNKGNIFEFDITTNTYTNLYNFDGTSHGQYPIGNSLIQISDSLYYGLTSLGGTHNLGTLYCFNSASNTVTKLHDFSGPPYGTDGNHPRGSLLKCSNGMLFGLTVSGGIHDDGIIFRFNPLDSTYLKVYDLDSTGVAPFGSLKEATNGKLYGLCNMGGANNEGTLFEFDPNTFAYTTRYDFDSTTCIGRPMCSVIQASNGKLYGLTAGNSYAPNDGALFEYNYADSSLNKVVNFADQPVGSYPHGSLIRASNGKFYGLTERGGTSDDGVLFEYDDETNIAVRKISFDGVNGKDPKGTLFEANNGKLYGMTSLGGIYNEGVLFEYDPTANSLVKKYDFHSIISGANPEGALMQASNGKLYGMTQYDTLNLGGRIFEYDIPSSTLTIKYNFALNPDDGVSPKGSLIEAFPGKLFGLASIGGTNGYGTLFEYDYLSNTYTKKNDFGSDPFLSAHPTGSLLKANNGILYGTTENTQMYGPDYLGDGILFAYDPILNSIVDIHDFSCFTEYTSHPHGSFIQAANGKLYGLAAGCCALYEYDPLTDTYTKKLGDSNYFFGLSTPLGDLLEYDAPPVSSGVSELTRQTEISVYPNPSSDQFLIEIKSYVNLARTITVYNANGALIFKQETSGNRFQLDLSRYPSGIYNLVVQSGYTLCSKKLILSK